MECVCNYCIDYMQDIIQSIGFSQSNKFKDPVDLKKISEGLATSLRLKLDRNIYIQNNTVKFITYFTYLKNQI